MSLVTTTAIATRRRIDVVASVSGSPHSGHGLFFRVRATTRKSPEKDEAKDQKDQSEAYRWEDVQGSALASRSLPAVAVSRAIVGKSILDVRSARYIIAQIAVPYHVDREANHCGDQRKDDDNGVEHFFASCDVLPNLLSQVARSPK